MSSHEQHSPLTSDVDPALSRMATEDIVNQFNNMLMAILGYTEMIRLGASSPADISFFAERIKDATERLAGLVRSMSVRQDRSTSDAS
jgi:hypothetical protein